MHARKKLASRTAGLAVSREADQEDAVLLYLGYETQNDLPSNTVNVKVARCVSRANSRCFTP